jgi:hypothetical protein
MRGKRKTGSIYDAYFEMNGFKKSAFTNENYFFIKKAVILPDVNFLYQYEPLPD